LHFWDKDRLLLRSGLHIWFRDGSNLRFGMYGNDTDALSLTTSTGVWYHYCFTYNHKSIEMLQLQETSYIGTGTVRIGTFSLVVC
jgi:hypothetical protein